MDVPVPPDNQIEAEFSSRLTDHLVSCDSVEGLIKLYLCVCEPEGIEMIKIYPHFALILRDKLVEVSIRLKKRINILLWFFIRNCLRTCLGLCRRFCIRTKETRLVIYHHCSFCLFKKKEQKFYVVSMMYWR